MPDSTTTLGTPVTPAPIGKAANTSSPNGNGHSEVIADSGKIKLSLVDASAVLRYTGNGDFGLTTGYIQSDTASRGVIRITSDQDFTYNGTQSTLVALAAATNATTLLITAPSATVNSGSLMALGAGSTALRVTGQGGANRGTVDVTVDGDISGAKRGVFLEQSNTAATGNVTLTSTAGNTITASAGNAVYILTKGSGAITINLADLVSATGGNAVHVRDTAIGGNISVTTAAVSASTAGFDAVNVQSLSTTANVTIVTNGAISAAADGIFGFIKSSSATGNLSITNNGTVNVGHNGIEARNYGRGSTTVAVNGNLTATNEGIVVIANHAAAGTISVTTAAGRTLSVGADGIDIETVGSGNILVDNAAAMTSSGTGADTLDDGIDINADGGGSVTINNSGAIGTAGDRARENGMDLSIANAASAGNFSITGSGAIFSVDTGIDVSTKGSGAVSVVYSGTINSTKGHGVQVDTTSGAITVSTSGAIITPAGNGIETTSSTGNQTVTVGANINGDVGVHARSTSGAITIDINGGNITASHNAVDALSSGSKTITVAEGRTLSGDLGIVSIGTGATTITNSGTVNGTVTAISSTTSATTLTNLAGGTIQGAINLSALNDSVVNNGTIVGALTLGAGADLYDGRNGSISGTINGGDGNDTLRGGAGAETMIGGLGDDILEGNGGSDILTGGAGNDSFRDTAAGLNGDTITDFAAGDKIIITNADPNNFSFSLSGNTLTYTGGSVTLSGFTGQLVASAAAGGGVQLTVFGQASAAAIPVGDTKAGVPEYMSWQPDSGTVANGLGQAFDGFVPGAHWDMALTPSWQVMPDLII